jgi:hypothetical protein
LKFHPRFATTSVARKPLLGAIAGLTAAGIALGATAYADPAQDNIANFNELSKQAQQMIETVQTVQLDLDKKLRLQSEAEQKHREDLAALGAAEANLAVRQSAVDKLAAAVYTGGPADGTAAFLTAASPQSFIDKLDVQRVMATEMTEQIKGMREIKQQAESVAAASAAEAAAALRMDLQRKQSQLQAQIADLKLRYNILTPAEQALLGPGAAIPTVGMSGLVPNARALAAYIISTYPGVQSIGGVRADPLPDHPSGHAIDIMIGSDMALGDAINADVQSQMGRFNVSYTMWRVPSHFNHVHVTVH